MANRRLIVRKAREILRHHFGAKLSNRQVADILKISRPCVAQCLKRFESSGLSWPLPADLKDSELIARLYPRVSGASQQGPLPDWDKVHRELSRKHMTLQLLWEEYRENYQGGLGRTRFYTLYAAYAKHKNVTIRMDHKGGEKLYVDYSGDGLSYIERATGEVVPVELFVASWGASSYSYSEATHTQKSADWIGAHNRAFLYFKCLPYVLVPDNTKTAVNKAIFYEPVLNATYTKLAEYYDIVILPAKLRKPRYKAVVEANVLHTQRFILARLRDRQFFSLAEINTAIRALLEDYNGRNMQEYKVSRRQRFEEFDLPNAKTLPAELFPYLEVKYDVGVHMDYHVEFNGHYYSAPYVLASKRVDVMRTDGIVEIYHDHLRVTSHKVGIREHGFTTNPAHMPPHHRFVKGWTPEKMVVWAAKIGPFTAEAIKKLMLARKHPEQGFRAALGIMNLRKKYVHERIENAAKRALHFKQLSYGAITEILKQGLDQKSLPGERDNKNRKTYRQTILHENIRGGAYFGDQMEMNL